MVQRWVDTHKREHGARRRIELARAVLRSALSEAKRLHLVPLNAAMDIKDPKRKKKQIMPVTVEEARLILELAETHRLRAVFLLVVTTGLRIAEALGIRWSDVDLDTGEIEIRQQLQSTEEGLVLQDLKTEKSRRTLLLPPIAVEALGKHRQQQNEERLQAGERWTNSGLVFTTYRMTKPGKGKTMKVGAAMHQRNVTRIWYQLLEDAEIAKRGIHNLRHSAASFLIAAEKQTVEISQLLGHSDVRTTVNLYGHLQKQTAAKAAAHMDTLFPAKAQS